MRLPNDLSCLSYEPCQLAPPIGVQLTRLSSARQLGRHDYPLTPLSPPSRPELHPNRPEPPDLHIFLLSETALDWPSSVVTALLSTPRASASPAARQL